ncbi:MAG: hypothetical protein U9N85_00160 [Bacteroidota bacterium]|nr:hypothetical protein [Bacteroidota bacterium]
MKKIVTVLAAVLFLGGILLTSCGTSNSYCPAYPPSTFQGDAQQTIDVEINELTIQNQEEL